MSISSYKGNTTGTKTNSKGEFNITVPASEKQVLWVSYLGFETQGIEIEKTKNPLEIKLEEDIAIQGEITILEYPTKKKDTINKVKSFFRKKHAN